MATTRTRLDAIDWQILAALQADGRMTNIDLARQIGLTPPPCLRRVKALEDAGLIRGYNARLNGNALGFTIIVFALVSLKSQAEDDLRAFEAHVQKIPEVVECHMLNGEIDFILKIVAHDLQEFQALLTSRLTTAPGVTHVKTSLTIRTSKDVGGLPIT
jgi:DNA-binding Lrp family transcriptional regulator